MTKHDSTHTLAELTGFGANPGALKGWLYLPTLLAPRTPLAVVLHGCTQDAAGYDRGSGWTQLAEKNGFAVLFPEQQRTNNANLCFNWFEAADTRRDQGEVESIRQMVDHCVLAHGLDRGRIFITGLSAGGAMANAMLASYPELFAGGAIIGGLPFGVANGVGEAFERMQGRNVPDTDRLHAALRQASDHGGSWPAVSVWHGTHDHTVKPVNAGHIADQWRAAHALDEQPDRVESVGGHARKTWLDRNGRQVLAVYMIKGMAHGVPLAASAERPLGQAGPFMLDAGISSTVRIAETWGLADIDDILAAEGDAAGVPAPDTETMPGGIESLVAHAMKRFKSTGPRAGRPAADAEAGEGVGKVITDALKAAGLMR